MKTDLLPIVYLAASALLCAGMTAYAQNAAVPAAKSVEIPVAAEETTETAAVETTEESTVKSDVPQADAEVTYAFADSFGIPHVVVKNNGEQIYGYTLEIKYYDKDKNEIDKKTAEIDAVVPSGLSDGFDRFIPKVEGAEYISAAVTGLKYLNETKQQQAVFNDELLLMSDINAGSTSADCSFIGIGEAGIVHQQGGSDLSDLRFDITNNSERAVASVEFLVAEYDKNGAPVSAKPNGYIKENVRKLSWENADLASGAKKTLASNMALNSDCASVKIIVNHVEFADRGVWANPGTLDWVLSQ